MAFLGQSIRLDFGFTLTGTAEIANTGIALSIPGVAWTGAEAGLAEIDTGTVMADIMDEMITLMSTASCGWADYSVLRSLKASAVGTDGHYLTEPVIYNDPAPTDGATTNVLPQSTIVVSLRSGFTLGKANYGRMYLPHTRPTITAGGPFVAGGTAEAIANAGQVFVENISAIVNAAMTDVVAPVIMSSIGAGTTRAILQVAVGNVIDTQRRRRNRLVETYSFA